ncbi:MAG: type III pantothenate kinase [Flavobacteriales bacterium]|jgi:type III pantothenate kinase
MKGGRWVLDVGNSRIKFASLAQDGALHVMHDDAAYALAVELEPEAVLTASSGVLPDRWMQLCARWGDRCVQLGSPSEDILPSDYFPVESLGWDRVANALAVPAAGSWAIVDAGTCITCDLVVNGRFLGGSIAPGILMRLHAMHTGTARLPEVVREHALQAASSLGTSTLGSMAAGAVHGARLEISGRIREWSQHYPDLHTVLTGGDAVELGLNDSVRIFADPEHTLKGYHVLLNRLKP